MSNEHQTSDQQVPGEMPADALQTPMGPQAEGAESLPPGRLAPRTDLFVGLGLILFGGVAAFESWRMPRFQDIGAEIYEAPGLVPGLLGLVIAVFGMLIVVRAVREGALHGGAVGARFRYLVVSVEARRLAILIGITVGYAWIFVGRMPFWLASFFFVAAFIILFDWREAAAKAAYARLIITALIQAVITALAVTYVFESIFRVRLP